MGLILLIVLAVLVVLIVTAFAGALIDSSFTTLAEIADEKIQEKRRGRY